MLYGGKDMNFSLSEICDVIILVGAVFVAIFNIIKYLTKPFVFFKKRRQREQEQYKLQLKRILDELIPTYFENYENSIKNKKEEDRLKLIESVTKQIMQQINREFEALRKISQEQNETIEILRKHQVDILRTKIEKIYHRYKDTKVIPRFAYENLQEYYTDYKENNGNHHIDKLYNRMSLWEISEEPPDYDKE